MIHAADRDSIALQYANRFRDVFEIGCAALQFAMDTGEATEEALIVCHLELMARVPDTLIARKRGRGEAEASACRAEHVLALGGLRTPEGITALHDFDRWLRAEGNSRNPGTTADLVAACLFAMLREGRMQWPSERPFASSRSSL